MTVTIAITMAKMGRSMKNLAIHHRPVAGDVGPV
jgi:hypothetical protein